MITVTQSAIRQLRALIVDHPEDPIIRITVKDLNEERVAFSITLEATPQPDDEVQRIYDLTVAIEASSAPRMDGVTLDYVEPDGFKFLHTQSADDDKLRIINLN